MVTRAPSSSAQNRRPVLRGFLLFSLTGLVGLGVGLTELISAARAIAEQAPLVTFTPALTITLGPALALFAFGAMSLVDLIPEPPDRIRRKRGPRPKSRKERAVLALYCVVAAGVILTFVMPPAAQFVVGEIMLDRGYTQCPDSGLGRHAPIQWARPGTSCPR